MAVVNSYNYSKPKNYVNVNIGKKQADVPVVAARSKEMDKSDLYLEQKVMSAKPEELTYMLYEGMVRFIKKAMAAVEVRDIQKIHNNTVKAQNIVTELRATLDMSVEVSANLDALYEYLEHKLLEANISKSMGMFEDALVVAEELKETWRQAFHLS